MTRPSRIVLGALLAVGVVGVSPSSGTLAPADRLAAAVRSSRGGDLQAARTALQSLLPEPGPVGGRAAYLLGRVDLRLRRFDEAASAFARAADLLPVLADYARYYQAVADFDRGRFSESASLCDEVLARYPRSTVRARTLFLRGESLWGARSPEAPDAFRRYLEADPHGEDAARAWFDMGQALEQQARWGEAAQAYRRVQWAFPDSRYNRPAAERLAALAAAHRLPPDTTPPEVFLERAVAEMESGRGEAAREDFFRVIALAPRQPVADEARYRLGVMDYQAHRVGVAAQFFQRVWKDSTVHGDDALFYMVRIALVRGRAGEALHLAQLLATRYPRSSLAPRAFYVMGQEWAHRGDWERALATYREAADRFPGTRWGGQAAWAEGWVLSRVGRWSEARKVWVRLAAEASEGETAASGLYWAARADLLLGRPQRARDEYRRAALEYPDTYYGQRAADRLGQPLRVEVGPPPPEVPQGKVVSLDRYRELEALGEEEDATRELEAAARTAPAADRVAVLVLLGRRYAAQGQVTRSVEMLEDATDGRVRPLALWELLYPRPHWREVVSAASQTGVDPYLLAAVMREESRFDPRAVSAAGAYGLMQLMPETARIAAGMVGLRPPDLGALTDPATNVALGAAVLKSELARFHRVDLALAAYNAGPGAVSRWWRERAGADQDTFIEEIPYPETRSYVKAVLSSWGVYRWLYRAGHPSP